MLDTGPKAGIADVLAWEARGNDVDGRQVFPGDGGQIAEVRGVWESATQDGADMRLVVSAPHDGAAERGLHGLVETAVAGAKRTNPKLVRFSRCLHEDCSFLRLLLEVEKLDRGDIVGVG
ncbi:hypothetical protein VA596_04255 [Amycolatopsis sp., V23-08]|uniref:Uncharacterized protein n=1 Tax=Amycolatopsis heterodermiae TaxID=3110235 RepID=A0ABU5QXT1_9PSEU|nr:hypothetical protein [Amycolatopsis sp., V23-08]MEA5358737.1 hypothetical protein [Amycolatopsis sp., V23-08]